MIDMVCIKDNYGHAIRDSCVEECERCHKCEVFLNGKDEYLVLKADVIVKDKPMCDFIIFRLKPRGRPILIEMKGRTFKVEQAKAQLINGSALAKTIARKCFGDWSPESFHPILVCREWDIVKHRMATDDFLRLSGKKHRVIIGECGDRLSTILRASGK